MRCRWAAPASASVALRAQSLQRRAEQPRQPAALPVRGRARVSARHAPRPEVHFRRLALRRFPQLSLRRLQPGQRADQHDRARRARAGLGRRREPAPAHGLGHAVRRGAARREPELERLGAARGLLERMAPRPPDDQAAPDGRVAQREPQQPLLRHADAIRRARASTCTLRSTRRYAFTESWSLYGRARHHAALERDHFEPGGAGRIAERNVRRLPLRLVAQAGALGARVESR